MSRPPIPQAVLRALRLIQAHGSVVSVEARPIEGTGVTAVTVKMKTELLNVWRATGQSPSGVRAIEPILFVFNSGYPLLAPHISLRSDFDRCHPHILPGSANENPEPCLVAGSQREVLRMRGIIGLIEQLAEWLERAAFAKLIDQDQGWEPTRRDHIDDFVIADGSWLTAMPTRDGGCSAFGLRYLAALAANNNVTYCTTLAHSAPIAISENLTGTFTYMQGDGFRVGDGMALVAWSGKKPDGARYVADRYRPETVSTIGGLLARADELGVRAHLEPKLNLLQSRFQTTEMNVPVPLVVIMLAKRPGPVIGTGVDIEICPYVVELSGGDALSRGSSKTVRAAAHRDDVSVPLLKRAAGDSNKSEGPWTLIGCGSVGSKIAAHMARVGRGPKVLIDRANMQPHNYARHVLFPNAHGSAIALPTSKARLLGDALSSLKQTADPHDVDVVSHVARTRSLKPFVDEATMMVVNTTASASVRETLSSTAWTGLRPRVVEACIFGIGQVGVFTVEGPCANPSTVDLICETYSALHARRDLRETIFGQTAAEIAVGQGCSALTLPLPDSRLSMFAAPMAERLAKLHRDGLPTGGSVMLGVLKDDLNVEWVETPVAPRIIIQHGDMEIRIAPAVHATVVAEIAARPRSETGGIIYGRYCDVTDSFHIVGTLPAPPDSKFSAEEFVLGTEGLRPLLTDLIDGSGGALYPLGTWHNHLVPSGPSVKDMGTAALLSGMKFFPLLMLIHTPAGYQALIVETLPKEALARDEQEK